MSSIVDAKKILVIFGTRPEAIKLAPVILQLRRRSGCEIVICSTGQHRDMVSPVCDLFGITPHYDLEVMRPGQQLTYVASAITDRISAVIERERPDLAIVQGDTTTAFAATLGCFYNKVPVAHVEAGLRTWDNHSPFPEEMHRVLVGRLASFHFAPTELAASNLRAEGIAEETIFVTGNTVVDAALSVGDGLDHERAARIECELGLRQEQPVILFTMHRRENFGSVVDNVFTAMRRFCAETGVRLLFPVHPNPNVMGPALRILGHEPNVTLCEPLDYEQIVFALRRCRFVITDSGGLVEEAPTFNKPVLVLRDSTERTESIDAGGAVLCGRDVAKLTRLSTELLTDGDLFRLMSSAPNPFGDGQASTRIADVLLGTAQPQLKAA